MTHKRPFQCHSDVKTTALTTHSICPGPFENASSICGNMNGWLQILRSCMMVFISILAPPRPWNRQNTVNNNQRITFTHSRSKVWKSIRLQSVECKTHYCSVSNWFWAFMLCHNSQWGIQDGAQKEKHAISTQAYAQLFSYSIVFKDRLKWSLQKWRIFTIILLLQSIFCHVNLAWLIKKIKKLKRMFQNGHENNNF